MRHTDPGIVAVLAYDGLCTFEYGIAIELFDLDRPELGVPWYDCRIVGVDGREARGSGGVLVRAHAGVAALRHARTIVVPGWRDRAEPPPEPARPEPPPPPVAPPNPAPPAPPPEPPMAPGRPETRKRVTPEGTRKNPLTVNARNGAVCDVGHYSTQDVANGGT
jgi:hypothetical protein